MQAAAHRTTRGSPVTVRWRLFLASVLMLFLELSLIRWLGANVVHLSYFSNFVLLGSFLGIGLGFLRAAGPTHSDRPLAVLLTGRPTRSHGLRQRLSGHGGSQQQPTDLLQQRRVAGIGSAHLVDAAVHLPRGRRGACRSRRDRRCVLSAAASARGLSLRSDSAVWPASPRSLGCRSSTRRRWCGSASSVHCSSP